MAPTSLLPLARAPTEGDEIVVPATVWSTYQCAELGGAGWLVTVVAVSRHTAVVRFNEARTRDGRRYANERLPIDVLRTR